MDEGTIALVEDYLDGRSWKYLGKIMKRFRLHIHLRSDVR